MTSDEAIAWAKANGLLKKYGVWSTQRNNEWVWLWVNQNGKVVVVHEGRASDRGTQVEFQSNLTLAPDITPADLDVIVKAFGIPVTKQGAA
jgi:hypothetical protein